MSVFDTRRNGHKVTMDLVKGKVLPDHAMKAYKGRRDIAPPILNLGTKWEWVDNFTPRPLYPQERTRVPTEQDAVWAPEPVWTIWRRHNIIKFEKESLSRTKNWTPGPSNPQSSRYPEYACPVPHNGHGVLEKDCRKIQLYWNTTPCITVKRYQSFGGACFLHLQESESVRGNQFRILGSFLALFYSPTLVPGVLALE